MNAHRRVAGLVGGWALALVIPCGASAGAIDLEWATPTINVGVGGAEYPTESTVSFFGTPVAVPGDSARRTVIITNNGPTDATLTVALVDAASGPDNRIFLENVLLSWDLAQGTETGSMPLQSLVDAGDTVVGEIPLARSESVSLQVSHSVSHDLEQGNAAYEGTATAGFNVHFRLGDSAVDGSQPPGPGDRVRSLPDLPPTGAIVAGVIGLAALLLAVGFVLIRRRGRSVS